ncbi:MAG TPA: hypothetical protein VFS32_08570, partial [Candidatus Limnocylindrales bacterium]|nr:hypothetical protein [Candidatus Limnocylindrales bacterium]
DGRAVNRHDFSLAEIEAALERPVVRRIVDLIRIRNTHPAFAGDLAVSATDRALSLEWCHAEARCRLEVDLASGAVEVTAGGPEPTATTSD